MLTLDMVDALERSRRVKRDVNLTEALHKARRVNDAIRAFDPDYMPASVVTAFLQIAATEPVHMQKLAADLNASQSSVSRLVSYLGSNHDRAMGLVEAVEDPTNRRRKIVRLTATGSALLASIALILQQ
jgi:DNA-binding MarR family transcriptional regulator